MEQTGSSFNVAKATARHQQAAVGQEDEAEMEFAEICKGLTLAVAYSGRCI